MDGYVIKVGQQNLLFFLLLFVFLFGDNADDDDDDDEDDDNGDTIIQFLISIQKKKINKQNSVILKIIFRMQKKIKTSTHYDYKYKSSKKNIAEQTPTFDSILTAMVRFSLTITKKQPKKTVFFPLKEYIFFFQTNKQNILIHHHHYH